MHNYFKNKCKKGDISILVTLLVCSILLILLTPISQKLSVESKISRENLMSQQAVQAARTGLDAWLYNWLAGQIDETSAGREKNWPNGNTPPTQVSSNDWIVLDNASGIQYRVEFIQGSGSNPSIVRSTGRVVSGATTIERVLEDERRDL